MTIRPLQDKPTKSNPDLDLPAAKPSPPLSVPLLRMSVCEGTIIPTPLITALDTAYLLHLLARDPPKVVAPGKSLLSVLSGLEQTAAHPPESTLQKPALDLVHRAFWDQDFEALSSPQPSSQISRLKALYKDLHGALAPLFPSKHPVLVTFSLPLPPTSSPLLSAIAHIRDTLLALRERCAPVRDDTIDGILHQMHHRSPSASREDLAKLLINMIQSILDLSLDMRKDYSNAVLATASEQELIDMAGMMAEAQEQRLVLQLWESKEVMRKAWKRWLEGFCPADPTLRVQKKQFWILKLIESLGKAHPVAAKLVGPHHLHGVTNVSDRGDPDAGTKRIPEPSNMLPPQFLFSGPALLRSQNCIQALTIAASLKSLVPTPRTSPPLSQSETGNSTSPINPIFTERIWALLEPEIGKTHDGPSETKIINLADEVVVAHSNIPSPGVTKLDAHVEQRLRSTVERILRTDDPVFILLQKRLLSALSATLLSIPAAAGPASIKMQSGRSQHKMGISSSLPEPWSVQREVVVAAKGFEDPVIAKQYSAAASALRRSVEWVERVWGDTMPY